MTAPREPSASCHRWRVVSHDDLAKLRAHGLAPEVRRWRVREMLTQAGHLAAGGAVLGLTWVLCRVLIALVARR